MARSSSRAPRPRGALLALCVVAAARAGRAPAADVTCAAPTDALAAHSDFDFGLGGWSAGNTSEWAHRLGCATGVPCPAAGGGYLLAVGEGAPLVSPPVQAACLTLSYFAAAGVELVVEALDAAGAARPLGALPPSRAWRVSPSLALPPDAVRVRVLARATSPAVERWAANAAGVDDVLFLLTADGAAAARAAPPAEGVAPPLAPRSARSPVGVDVSTLFAAHPPSLARLAALVRARGLQRAKLYQYDARLVGALAAAGVREFVVGIPNAELHNLALSLSHAVRLVDAMGAHADLIALVVVGNEPLAKWWGDQFADELPRALAHVAHALRTRGWQARATVSLQAGVLVDSWPPSAARFDPELPLVVDALLPQLAASGAPLLLNLYPYLAWREAEGLIPLDWATFAADASCARAGKDAPCYSNLLDAMVDASTHALVRAGFPQLKLAIGEVGWPTGGVEAGADASTACAFTNALIGRAAFGSTPLGARLPPLFVFELLDEGLKATSGEAGLGASERRYGLLAEGGGAKYGVDWTPADAPSVAAAVARCPARATCAVDADCPPPPADGGADGAASGDGASAGSRQASAGSRQACFVQRSHECAPRANATDAQVGAALDWLCAPAQPQPAQPAPPKGARGAPGAPAGDGGAHGGGVDCSPLHAATGARACAAAPLRAKAAWAATRYARLRGSAQCSFGGAFEWAAAPHGGGAAAAWRSAAGACALGVCEDAAAAAAPPPVRAGDFCRVAADCGRSVQSLHSLLPPPTCARPRTQRMLGAAATSAAAAGSCRPRDEARQAELLAALSWACSEGGVDCTAMRALCAGAPLRERAAWAFTRYAIDGGAGATCSFAGVAELSSMPLAEAAPGCDLGTCRFPPVSLWQSPVFVLLLLALLAAYATLRVRESAQLARARLDALVEGGELPRAEAAAGGAEGAAATAADGGVERGGGGGDAPRAAGAEPERKATEMQML